MNAGTGTYTLEGRTLSGEDLLNFCRAFLADRNAPPWKKEAVGFINDFLEGIPLYHETSGTTGVPKRFLLDRSAMEQSAGKTLAWFGLEKGDPVLLCLPVRYIAGKMMIVRALLGGLDLYFAEPSSRPLREENRNYRFVPMVPLQLYESILNHDDIRRAGRILIGGAETGSGLQKMLEETEDPEVYESFGMSETYSHFALRRINGVRRDPLFRLMDGVNASTDERGCLVVDIPGITRGSLVTNDMAEVAEGGRAFRWLGRADHVINTGGIKVNPEPLEERMSVYLGAECILVPLPDEKLGKKMVLVAETAGSADTTKWLNDLKEKFEAHEVPRHILTVDLLPRNAWFKPDRKKTLRMAADLLSHNP